MSINKKTGMKMSWVCQQLGMSEYCYEEVQLGALATSKSLHVTGINHLYGLQNWHFEARENAESEKCPGCASIGHKHV